MYTGYGQYKGRTHGRLLHCLHAFCPIRIVRDNSFVGAGKVMLVDDLIAEYWWNPDDETDDKPFFRFVNHYLTREQADMCNKNAFFFRPFLDDGWGMDLVNYVVQELRNTLTLAEALYICDVRNVKKGDFGGYVGDHAEKLKEKILQVAASSSHDYFNEDNCDWKHLAMCAIYDI